MVMISQSINEEFFNKSTDFSLILVAGNVTVTPSTVSSSI